MFSIRRIFDAGTPTNRQRLAQVQSILRAQFPGLSERDIRKLPEQLMDPLKHRFLTMLLVAEDQHSAVRGFAVLMSAPDLKFCYLDFISVVRGETGRGIGGALYERVRDEALGLGVVGVFLECLPDDPALSPEPKRRRQNAARLRFYERYGARPVANTAYETPVQPGDDNPPYLVFDDLGQAKPLTRDRARRIVEAILERKYAQHCPPDYVKAVVDSFRDNPVKLREPRYRLNIVDKPEMLRPRQRRIALVCNDRHDIHHVREHGYVESPVRISVIRKELERTELFDPLDVQHYALRHIQAVHDRDFVGFLRKSCATLPAGKSIYPYVFPVRNHARPPKELPLRAGYYCIDTFTPLNANAFRAAVRAVDCALTAAERLLEGDRLAYALVRPPGHHAERRTFGGFCYFNSSAVAANFLCEQGRVAVLDIDYHHGNGTQDIFFRRNDVLTVSIHGHPRHTYPYFSGYENERGEAEGRGYNVNLPLPEGIDGAGYRPVLETALERIRKFAPAFLIVALGLDTARGDPTGSWLLNARDFAENGRLIGALKLPTVVVQEGGYRTRTLGVNARHFFTGLWKGSHGRSV